MEYTVSLKRGLWFAHPLGRPEAPIEGSASRIKISALQSAADAMGMSYGEYMSYRESRIRTGEPGWRQECVLTGMGRAEKPAKARGRKKNADTSPEDRAKEVKEP